jgi:hypothetical protein
VPTISSPFATQIIGVVASIKKLLNKLLNFLIAQGRLPLRRLGLFRILALTKPRADHESHYTRGYVPFEYGPG